ncbi:MAG: alpha/beta hydrolase [Planctomycetes bacterium]|nr:alpha/beta hydrolase [Planctomycetota bacterium]
MSEHYAIPFEGKYVDSLSAAWDLPLEGDGAVVVFAHGAGAPMESPFMAEIAAALASAGSPVLRFAYPYTERAAREERRMPPDRMPTLLEAHKLACEYARERFPGRPLVLAGKSMGGRASTMLAAEGEECAAIVLFGYPLQRPKAPHKPRVAHFPDVRVPTLFLQGTRDQLAPLGPLREHLPSLGAEHTLEIIDGADHGFSIRKTDPDVPYRPPEEVQADLVARTLTFLKRHGLA